MAYWNTRRDFSGLSLPPLSLSLSLSLSHALRHENTYWLQHHSDDGVSQLRACLVLLVCRDRCMYALALFDNESTTAFTSLIGARWRPTFLYPRVELVGRWCSTLMPRTEEERQPEVQTETRAVAGLRSKRTRRTALNAGCPGARSLHDMLRVILIQSFKKCLYTLPCLDASNDIDAVATSRLVCGLSGVYTYLGR